MSTQEQDPSFFRGAGPDVPERKKTTVVFEADLHRKSPVTGNPGTQTDPRTDRERFVASLAPIFCTGRVADIIAGMLERISALEDALKERS